jgi:hypothetical protein
MKDAEVVAHTKEERFIRIQLDNPQEVPPGIIVTPEPAFSNATNRSYTALRVSGIVPYSLIHVWNDKHPHNALAIGDLLRDVGGKAIAQLTASKTNKFMDIEKMNVEQHLCSPTLDATFRTIAVCEARLKSDVRDYVQKLAHDSGHPTAEALYESLLKEGCSEFAITEAANTPKKTEVEKDAISAKKNGTSQQLRKLKQGSSYPVMKTATS